MYRRNPRLRDRVGIGPDADGSAPAPAEVGRRAVQDHGGCRRTIHSGDRRRASPTDRRRVRSTTAGWVGGRAHRPARTRWGPPRDRPGGGRVPSPVVSSRRRSPARRRFHPGIRRASGGRTGALPDGTVVCCRQEPSGSEAVGIGAGGCSRPGAPRWSADAARRALSAMGWSAGRQARWSSGQARRPSSGSPHTAMTVAIAATQVRPSPALSSEPRFRHPISDVLHTAAFGPVVHTGFATCLADGGRPYRSVAGLSGRVRGRRVRSSQGAPGATNRLTPHPTFERPDGSAAVSVSGRAPLMMRRETRTALRATRPNSPDRMRSTITRLYASRPGRALGRNPRRARCRSDSATRSGLGSGAGRTPRWGQGDGPGEPGTHLRDAGAVASASS